MAFLLNLSRAIYKVLYLTLLLDTGFFEGKDNVHHVLKKLI